MNQTLKIGLVSISDRASSGVYEDRGLPALKEWLGRALRNPLSFEARLIPDEAPLISATLIELVDAGCSLVLTTGGTGPALRDVTPEATREILDRELLGIAEALRASGLSAGIIDAGLSRGLAGVSGSTLVVNVAGSRYAVRDGMATLNPLAAQIIGQLSSLEI